MKFYRGLGRKEVHVADISGICLKIFTVAGWHFILLPIGLLWSLTLIGLYDGGLTWSAFFGAAAFLAILRSAIK